MALVLDDAVDEGEESFVLHPQMLDRVTAGPVPHVTAAGEHPPAALEKPPTVRALVEDSPTKIHTPPSRARPAHLATAVKRSRIPENGRSDGVGRRTVPPSSLCVAAMYIRWRSRAYDTVIVGQISEILESCFLRPSNVTNALNRQDVLALVLARYIKRHHDRRFSRVDAVLATPEYYLPLETTGHKKLVR